MERVPSSKDTRKSEHYACLLPCCYRATRDHHGCMRVYWLTMQSAVQCSAHCTAYGRSNGADIIRHVDIAECIQWPTAVSVYHPLIHAVTTPHIEGFLKQEER